VHFTDGTELRQELSTWRGRLAVRVVADGTDDLLSVSAGFEFDRQHAAKRRIVLHRWWYCRDLDVVKKRLRDVSKSEVRRVLERLMDQVLGTAAPVEALFAWVGGTNASAKRVDRWRNRSHDGHHGSTNNPSPAELQIVTGRCLSSQQR
jgi:outer membrane biogenesis lipoprotein LolB